MNSPDQQVATVFLAGDVMTGRGIDQILPHPGNTVIYEPVVHDARGYVDLAERASGKIPRPADFEYIWGDALAELRQAAPNLKVINLETAVTSRGQPWPGKSIHYHMHPQNVGCLKSAGIDCCCLANNHVMDWGRTGLEETLETLDKAGIRHAGAGRNASEAMAPATFEAAGSGRVLVVAVGSPTSGVPSQWRATPHQPGVNLLEDLSNKSADDIEGRLRQVSRPGDVAIVSVHWGDNWGYEIPTNQTLFARRLIDKGVSIVFGHSSHHFKAIEVYRERLVLYGCGDFINDYEGIRGKEEFRSDLRLMYLVGVEVPSGKLATVRIVPFRVSRFRLGRASPADAGWVADVLNLQGANFGTRANLQPDNSIVLQWRAG